jgi:hypothetical protein
MATAQARQGIADIIALARQYGRYGYFKIAGLLEQSGFQRKPGSRRPQS